MQEFVSFVVGALIVGAIFCRLAYQRGYARGAGDYSALLEQSRRHYRELSEMIEAAARARSAEVDKRVAHHTNRLKGMEP